MKEDVDNVLSGVNNQRLSSKLPIRSGSTEARADENEIIEISKVTIPSMDNVYDAKEWVDNGSQL